jgi:hypothetical protein
MSFANLNFKIQFGKRFMRMCKKAYTTFRDNSIVSLLQHLHLPFFANSYSWLTTETLDTVVFTLTTNLGVTSINTKYIILFIITFLL